jgi:hypothetical protein
MGHKGRLWRAWTRAPPVPVWQGACPCCLSAAQPPLRGSEAWWMPPLPFKDDPVVDDRRRSQKAWWQILAVMLLLLLSICLAGAISLCLLAPSSFGTLACNTTAPSMVTGREPYNKVGDGPPKKQYKKQCVIVVCVCVCVCA